MEVYSENLVSYVNTYLYKIDIIFRKNIFNLNQEFKN